LPSPFSPWPFLRCSSGADARVQQNASLGICGRQRGSRPVACGLHEGAEACTRDALGTRPEAARLTVGGRSPTSTAHAGDERCHPDRSSSGARRAPIRRGTTNGSPNPIPSLMTTNPVLLMVESDGPVIARRGHLRNGAAQYRRPVQALGRSAEEDGATLGRRRLRDHLVPERVVAVGEPHPSMPDRPPSPTGTASGGRSAPGRWSSSCSPRRSPPASAGSGAAARSAPSP
jgi:hypothetical protein